MDVSYSLCYEFIKADQNLQSWLGPAGIVALHFVSFSLKSQNQAVAKLEMEPHSSDFQILAYVLEMSLPSCPGIPTYSSLLKFFWSSR